MSSRTHIQEGVAW